MGTSVRSYKLGVMEFYLLLAFTLLFSSTLWPCDGGKVLVFPTDGSHWLNMKILVEKLHSQGHELTVIRTSQSWYISENSPHYTSISIKMEHLQYIEDAALMSAFLKRSLDIRRRQGSLWSFLGFHQNLNEIFQRSHIDVTKIVTSILEDKTLIKQLNESRFDLLLTDPLFPGGPLLGRYLKLPMVYNARWASNGDSHFSIAPSPLSYVPQMFSHNSDKMDFFQRVNNIISHMTFVYRHYFVSKPAYQAVCDRYFGPNVDVLSVMLEADIWLIRSDFTFDFPRPTMPNVAYIGGFQGKPAKPLPPDLEEFMQSSGDHGVVVMTLGTLLGDLGPELSDAIASAFAKLPQKVVWRNVGERPSTLGNNTKLVKWLPQNDILGHPKTKLFIAHGGTNGLYEAIYHGVPVLGIPLLFDQDDNFVRLKARGAAETVEISTLDVESMTKALKNILDPEKPYRQNMHKLSQLFHDKPMKPLDTAVFWIEYVMRNKGAAHLRTESYKLPWYVYHCLDVMVFFLVIELLIVSLIWVSCRLFIRLIIRMIKDKPKRE